MKYIGIIAAMNEEIDSIKILMKDISIKNIFELEFIIGKIHSKDVVLVKCGVGKVNAARTTQILIDNYKPEYIINVGTAGGLKDNINIGDVVIADKLVQHDFDITADGHEKGYISNLGKYFYSNKDLINRTEKIMKKLDEGFNAFIGTIATGDVFVQDLNVKKRIQNEFNPDCTEMEGAAIGHAAYLNNIPYIVVRAISDKADDSASVDYPTFEKEAINNLVNMIREYVKSFE